MHILPCTRAVSNATLSSEDENERDLTRTSIPQAGVSSRRQRWTTDLMSVVHPFHTLINRGSRSTALILTPHGTIDADPLVDAERHKWVRDRGTSPRSTACPTPEWIGPNNWCTEDRTNNTKQWPHIQGRSPPTLYGRAKHAVQPYRHGTATYCPLPWRMLPRASRPIHTSSPRTRRSGSQRDMNWSLHAGYPSKLTLWSLVHMVHP